MRSPTNAKQETVLVPNHGIRKQHSPPFHLLARRHRTTPPGTACLASNQKAFPAETSAGLLDDPPGDEDPYVDEELARLGEKIKALQALEDSQENQAPETKIQSRVEPDPAKHLIPSPAAPGPRGDFNQRPRVSRDSQLANVVG